MGSRSPNDLKRRRERVAKIRQLREAEERGEYDEEDEDAEEELEPDEGEYCEKRRKNPLRGKRRDGDWRLGNSSLYLCH